jgi:hypothetical protein
MNAKNPDWYTIRTQKETGYFIQSPKTLYLLEPTGGLEPLTC